MSDDPAFALRVKMQRGESTDDRDTLTADVTAESIEELEEKVAQLREQMEEWAVEFREIQPTDHEALPDDQASFAEVSES